ncbi:hypothetical protein AB0M28_39095 [Streptomyces sp. NPDC051940]|uniref:hypothetical protein n=1 Tax=Streptomyces sp. NPDC051940 TaxID=3155675 RepID=UPI00343533DB
MGEHAPQPGGRGPVVTYEVRGPVALVTLHHATHAHEVDVDSPAGPDARAMADAGEQSGGGA